MTGAAGDATRDRAITGPSGLQPERTSLAWQRTSLGFLINSGLLLLREAARPANVLPRLILAVVALAFALACTVLGRRRNKQLLTGASLPTELAPSREVGILGWSVLVLGAGCVLVLALPS